MKMGEKKTAENYLDKIPVFCDHFIWSENEEKLVTIYVENKGFFCRVTQRLLHKPKITQIHLDDMGSYIFSLMDGNKSIYEIALNVRKRFGKKAEPLYDRLITYMHTLERCGFIMMR